MGMFAALHTNIYIKYILKKSLYESSQDRGCNEFFVNGLIAGNVLSKDIINPDAQVSVEPTTFLSIVPLLDVHLPKSNRGIEVYLSTIEHGAG